MKPVISKTDREVGVPRRQHPKKTGSSPLIANMSCCLFLVTDRELVVTDRELLVTDTGLVVLLSTDNGKFGRFCFNPTRIHNRVAEPSNK